MLVRLIMIHMIILIIYQIACARYIVPVLVKKDGYLNIVAIGLILGVYILFNNSGSGMVADNMFAQVLCGFLAFGAGVLEFTVRRIIGEWDEPFLHIGQPVEYYDNYKPKSVFPDREIAGEEIGSLTGCFRQGLLENLIVFSEE